MKRLKIKPLAQNDLDEIWFHIAQDNLKNADMFLDKLLSQCESLKDFPYTGTDRSNLAPDLRSFPVGSYIIFYHVLRGDLEIVRVLHGARNVEVLMSDEVD